MQLEPFASGGVITFIGLSHFLKEHLNLSSLSHFVMYAAGEGNFKKSIYSPLKNSYVESLWNESGLKEKFVVCILLMF